MVAAVVAVMSVHPTSEKVTSPHSASAVPDIAPQAEAAVAGVEHHRDVAPAPVGEPAGAQTVL